MSVFARSGLAALSDLESPEWLDSFRHLEAIQHEFLAQESAFRSPQYIWPRDPLHNWSRVWEYPYAYHQLETWRTAWQGQGVPRVLDLGSGVTFFPFAAARLGLDVVCADVDPVCDKDLTRAIEVVAATPGSVSSRLIEGGALPFVDQEFDAIYCISVLEHIPDFELTVSEISRVLKPGGLLVLTVDIDLQGNLELAPVHHRKLLALLSHRFQYRSEEVTIHPLNMLDSARGPYALSTPSLVARARHLVKERLLRRLLGRLPNPLVPFRLAVHGVALWRR